METPSGPRHDLPPPALPPKRMITALKILAALVGFIVVGVFVLPLVMTALLDSGFLSDEGSRSLAESLARLNEQTEATRESWRELVASIRGD